MDPLNILINRAPNAGYIDQDGDVILHNGNSVAISGANAYYGSFSDILIINRGVHEPLEEYCFQMLLNKMKTDSPKMIELGAYWSHYSMWLSKEKLSAECIMVEPDAKNLEAGKRNFRKNGYEGEFIQKIVGEGGFKVDDFLDERSMKKLEILHSDIQGFEVDMLDGARQSLEAKKIDYLFISTHSDELHNEVLSKLEAADYLVEISSGFSEHTTSSDGFIFASSPLVSRVFAGFSPLGRSELLHLSSMDLVNYLDHVGLELEDKSGLKEV
ncbi:FkbM family methyltransferase [SAR92 clade bacterium H231]|nr:FkbM family methyltransferase [SAR92 clade bacterium H231]